MNPIRIMKSMLFSSLAVAVFSSVALTSYYLTHRDNNNKPDDKTEFDYEIDGDTDMNYGTVVTIRVINAKNIVGIFEWSGYSTQDSGVNIIIGGENYDTMTITNWNNTFDSVSVPDTIEIMNNGYVVEVDASISCRTSSLWLVTAGAGAEENWPLDGTNQEVIDLLCTTNANVDFSNLHGPAALPKSDILGISFDLSDVASTVGDNFLYGCTSFSYPLTLPKGITTIGDNFMNGCLSFDGELYLYPELYSGNTSDIVSVGTSFMYDCEILNYFNIGVLEANVFADSSKTFATDNGSSSLYHDGLLLDCHDKADGNGAAFREKFTNSTTEDYRKLLTYNSIWIDTAEYELLNTDEDLISMLCDDSSSSSTIDGFITSWRDADGHFIVYEFTKEQIKGITFKNDLTATSIGNNFLANCDHFNYAISIPSTITSIGSNFMLACSAFNSPFTLPNTLSTSDCIGANFLYKCNSYHTTVNIGMIPATSFQISNNSFGTDSGTAVCYTSGITLLGTGTYNDAALKNRLPDETTSPYRNLNITPDGPNLVTTGGSYSVTKTDKELADLLTYDYTSEPTDVSLPTTEGTVSVPYLNITGVTFKNDGTLTNIPSNFLLSVESPSHTGKGFINFNSALIIPNSVLTIGAHFLECMSADSQHHNIFNQQLTLSNNLVTIGNYFMDGCRVFNQPITLSNNLVTIGNYFMDGCVSFNRPIALPNSLYKIGNYFMNGCTVFNKAITLSSDLSTLHDIGDYFMSDCIAFDTGITYPVSLSEIGENFLSGCSSFNEPITIPRNIHLIETGFLMGCAAFNSSLTFDYYNNQDPFYINTKGEYSIYWNENGFMNGCILFNKNITFSTGSYNIGIGGYNFMNNCKSMASTIDFGSKNVSIWDAPDTSDCPGREGLLMDTIGPTLTIHSTNYNVYFSYLATIWDPSFNGTRIHTGEETWHRRYTINTI